MSEKLSLQNIMSYFRERWSKLPDVRKPNNNTRYSLATGVLSAFAVFFMQSASFLAHQRLLESKKGRSNARNLFQGEEIPSDPLYLQARIARRLYATLAFLDKNNGIEKVTNHLITSANVALITKVGRSRWKIENENNNTLKTKGYHLAHNFGHGQKKT